VFGPLETWKKVTLGLDKSYLPCFLVRTWIKVAFQTGVFVANHQSHLSLPIFTIHRHLTWKKVAFGIGKGIREIE
jgi:hypothetical protein